MSSEKELQAKREELLSISESKEGYLAREWLLAIQAVKDLASFDDLMIALSNKHYAEIGRIFNPQAIQSRLLGFKNALSNIYSQAGGQVASNVETAGIYRDQVNPQLAGVVDRWTGNLIKHASQETIQRIGEEIGKATLQGKNPIAASRSIRDSVGLTPDQIRAIENYERKLRNGESVSRYKLRDKRFDKTKRPLNEEDIIKRVDRYTQNQLKHRAETIARNEALRMVNMANHHVYENAIKEGSIGANDYRKFWVARRDDKTRDAHRTIGSMNPDGRAIDEPFKSSLGDIMYPHDPTASAKNTINCRCVVIYSLQAAAFL
jgi:hypothetical protein